jgi:hypothetical protein
MTYGIGHPAMCPNGFKPGTNGKQEGLSEDEPKPRPA